MPGSARVGLRVAVNTGEVVVSDDHDDLVGDPVNVAARLQQEAGDGEVVIGEATQRLVAARVTLEPLGSVALKGRAEAVEAYRVVSLEPPAARRPRPVRRPRRGAGAPRRGVRARRSPRRPYAWRCCSARPGWASRA